MLRKVLIAGLILVGCSAPVMGQPLPGQQGPTAELLEGHGLRLSTRRTNDRFPDGNRLWKVELHRGERLLASWQAASGIAERQTADRLRHQFGMQD